MLLCNISSVIVHQGLGGKECAQRIEARRKGGVAALMLPMFDRSSGPYSSDTSLPALAGAAFAAISRIPISPAARHAG